MIERVAEWARAQGWDVARVIDAEGSGTDWEGSTEQGFYSTFGVRVQYETSAGEVRWSEVAGDEMESLWRFVMSDA